MTRLTVSSSQVIIMRDLKEYLKNFDELPFENIQSFYRKKNFLEVIHKIPKLCKVVEIGCGESSIFEYKKFQDQTIIEPIGEFLKRLGQRIEIENISVINSMVEDVETDEKFDLVVASCVLHEVEQQDAFIMKLKGFLKDTGYLYIDVPNALSLHRHLAVETGYIPSVYEKTSTQKNMQQNNTVFDGRSLNTFLNLHGLKVTQSGGYFLKPFHHQKMLDLFDTGQLTEIELDGLYEIGKNHENLASEIYALCQKDIIR